MSITQPGDLVFYARGGVAELMRFKGDECMLDGPAGTGKSRGSLEKLNALANKYPGCRLAIVRKVRASITETALVTFEQHVKPNCDTKNQQRNVRQSYKYPNGSEIIVAGLDNPVKLMSSEFDVIYVQEATELSLNDWEFLGTRLRNGVIPYQQLIGDCNPGAPGHWLNRRMNAGLTRRILSRHEDNPRLFGPRGQVTDFGRTYLERLDKLTGPRKERLRYGRWAAAEGLIYAFDAAVHIVDRAPESIERYFCTVDFGFTHAFVWQLWAVDNDGRMYRLKEIYRTQRTVRQHAAEIRRHIEGIDVEAWVCDHDAEGRATLEEELGIETTPADKAVSIGIQDVQARLSLADDGRARLFFVRGGLVEVDPLLIDEQTGMPTGPVCTEEEFDSYVWAKTRDDNLKEQPVKEHDHGLDATRYAVRYLDGSEGGGVEFFMAVI